MVGAQHILDALVDLGDRRVERFVEHGHDRANLVDGRRLVGAQRRRAPQRVDLLQHAARDPNLFGTAPAEVTLAEELGQSTDAARHCSTPGLGRVRREHRVEPHGLQALGRRVHSDLLAELRESAADRGGWIVAEALPSALAEHAHALVFLGEVDEMEVRGERPRYLVRALDREAFDDLRSTRESLGGLVRVRLDGGAPEPFDVVVQAC